MDLNDVILTIQFDYLFLFQEKKEKSYSHHEFFTFLAVDLKS